jgi:hypothetical protein
MPPVTFKFSHEASKVNWGTFNYLCFQPSEQLQAAGLDEEEQRLLFLHCQMKEFKKAKGPLVEEKSGSQKVHPAFITTTDVWKAQ